MKVYVDELPKSCVNCDFGYANNFCELDYELDLRKFDKNQKHPKCPLQSLTDYTKQVRKEVVQEIRKKLPDFIYNFQEPEVPRTKVIELEDIKYILDQIQGETK